MRTFDRYTANLRVITNSKGTFVQSYDTLVAKVDFEKKELNVLGWWSKTTSKHINYAAAQMNLTVKK